MKSMFLIFFGILAACLLILFIIIYLFKPSLSNRIKDEVNFEV